MINKIKEVVKRTNIQTKVERIDSPTFGEFFKIIIIDGIKSTFMLNTEEFIDLYAQMNCVQIERVNALKSQCGEAVQ